jgi:hypothetical protein
LIVLSTKEKGNAICQGAKISVVAGENVQSAESIYIVGGVISIFIAAEKKKDKNIMTKIHNAFSSEEWKKGFIKEFCNDHNGPVRFLRSVFYDEQDGAEQIIDFFAAELEKKEKEVNEIIKSIVPEKLERLIERDGVANGWNACIDELNKNIGE